MFGFGAFGSIAYGELAKIPGRIAVPVVLAAALVSPPTVNVGGVIQVPDQTTDAVVYAPWVRSSVLDTSLHGSMFGFGAFGYSAFGESVQQGSEVNIVVPDVVADAIVYAPFVTSGGSAFNVPTLESPAEIFDPTLHIGVSIWPDALQPTAVVYTPAIPRSMEPIRPNTVTVGFDQGIPTINAGVRVESDYVTVGFEVYAPELFQGVNVQPNAIEVGYQVLPPFIMPGTTIQQPELNFPAVVYIPEPRAGVRVLVQNETTREVGSSTFGRDAFSSSAFGGDGEDINVTSYSPIVAVFEMYAPTINAGARVNTPTITTGAQVFNPEISARRRKIRVQFILS